MTMRLVSEEGDVDGEKERERERDGGHSPGRPKELIVIYIGQMCGGKWKRDTIFQCCLVVAKLFYIYT